jgi:hypothetical protein
MFYCDDCGAINGWPTGTLARSKGKCEVCGDTCTCNDVPSSMMPGPPREQSSVKRLVGLLMEIHGLCRGPGPLSMDGKAKVRQNAVDALGEFGYMPDGRKLDRKAVEQEVADAHKHRAKRRKKSEMEPPAGMPQLG